MKEPKIKPKAPPPKTLDRSIRTSKGVRTGLSKTVDGIHIINKSNNALQKQIPDSQGIDKPETYAANNVAEKGEYAARKIGGKTAETTKKAVNKEFEKIRETS